MLKAWDIEGAQDVYQKLLEWRIIHSRLKVKDAMFYSETPLAVQKFCDIIKSRLDGE